MNSNEKVNNLKNYLKFLEDGESLFVKFCSDGDVCNVRGVIVVQAGDVLHDLGLVRLDGGQDKQVLQVPSTKLN